MHSSTACYDVENEESWTILFDFSCVFFLLQELWTGYATISLLFIVRCFLFKYYELTIGELRVSQNSVSDWQMSKTPYFFIRANAVNSLYYFPFLCKFVEKEGGGKKKKEGKGVHLSGRLLWMETRANLPFTFLYGRYFLIFFRFSFHRHGLRH